MLAKIVKPAIDAEAIRRAAELIRPHVRRTPVIEVSPADFGLRARKLVFKLELLQHAGSFKPRGAFTNLLTRDCAAGGRGGGIGRESRRGGCLRCAEARQARPRSSCPGCQRRGEDATESAPTAPTWWWAARSTTRRLQRATHSSRGRGAMPVHAYDQPETIIGQGTLGLELEEQAPDLDTLLVAVGGGGLIGGVAAWYARADEGSSASSRRRRRRCSWRLQAGEPVDAPAGGIAADSLAPRRVGALCSRSRSSTSTKWRWSRMRRSREAQRVLWDKLRLVTEPGGAAAFAALLSGRYAPRADETVGIVLCGGNTSAVNFAR